MYSVTILGPAFAEGVAQALSGRRSNLTQEREEAILAQLRALIKGLPAETVRKFQTGIKETFNRQNPFTRRVIESIDAYLMFKDRTDLVSHGGKLP